MAVDIKALFAGLREDIQKSTTPQTQTPPAQPDLTVVMQRLDGIDQKLTLFDRILGDGSNNTAVGPVAKMIGDLSDGFEQLSEVAEKTLDRIERLEGNTAASKALPGQANDLPPQTPAEKSAAQSGTWDNMLRQMRGGRKVSLR